MSRIVWAIPQTADNIQVPVVSSASSWVRSARWQLSLQYMMDNWHKKGPSGVSWWPSGCDACHVRPDRPSTQQCSKLMTLWVYTDCPNMHWTTKQWSSWPLLFVTRRRYFVLGTQVKQEDYRILQVAKNTLDLSLNSGQKKAWFIRCILMSLSKETSFLWVYEFKLWRIWPVNWDAAPVWREQASPWIVLWTISLMTKKQQKYDSPNVKY